MSQKPWLVNIQRNVMIDMSNSEYLDHLLKSSRTIDLSENQAKTKIRFLIWDLESIREEQLSFYNKFSFIIENEIRNLNRIMKLEPYPRNKIKISEASTSNIIC